MRVTGWPPIAIAAARFAAMVDLPSDCFGLVTTMTRGGLSTSMKARLVRSLRKASATAGAAARAGGRHGQGERLAVLLAHVGRLRHEPDDGHAELLSTSSDERSRRSSWWRTSA